MGHEVVAEVWRGDFLESVHHGTVVATDADGSHRAVRGPA